MIRFDVGSLNAVILAMDETRIGSRKAAEMAVFGAGRLLHGLIKQNMSLRDHSKPDLEALGHPYARRHGSIQIHTSGTRALRNPANRVHSQTGTLVGSLRGGLAIGRDIAYSVELDTGRAPYGRFVVQGTRVMLPRDVLWDTANAPDVQRRMMKEIVRVMGKRLRTKAALRLKP